MKNPQKGFTAPLLIWIIAILAIGSGIFLYTYHKGTPPLIVDKTAEWKTYNNPQFNFELRYPTSWLLDTKTFKPEMVYLDGIVLQKNNYLITINFSEKATGGQMSDWDSIVSIGTINNSVIYRTTKPEFDEIGANGHFPILVYSTTKSNNKLNVFDYALESGKYFYTVNYYLPNDKGINALTYNQEIIKEADRILSTLTIK